MRLTSILVGLCIAAGRLYGAVPYRAVTYDASGAPVIRVCFDVRATEGKSVALVPRDFRLLEDGKRTVAAERVIDYRETDLGVALIVLLDASPSMKGRPLEAIRRGMAQLISRKRKQDRVAVFSFANDVRAEARWDASAETIESVFRNLQTRGNRTRLYDAIGGALDEFDTEAQRDPDLPQRHTILVLSDGHDEGSRTSLETQIRRVTDSRTRVDSIGLARSPLWLTSLQALASAGFGAFRSTDTPEGLTDLLERGLDAVLQTPVLEFRAEQLTADGKSHHVGLVNTSDNWQDARNVKLPEYVFYRDWRVWAGLAAVAIVLLSAAAVAAYRRSRRVAVPAPPVFTQSPPTPAPPPVRRQPTVAEPQPAATAARRMTVVETAYRTEGVPPRMEYAPVVAASPARSATVLAPTTATPASLSAVCGPVAGRQVPLNVEEFWIGSAANNHLCLGDDPAVSGNHACIRAEGSVYRLYDNGSLNNTWVNGRGAGTTAVTLTAGDRIIIGQSEFLFQS